jgi:hypothetical protein
MTMSDNDDAKPGGDVDPAIFAQYRDLATDAVPVGLDQAVLRAAGNEIRRNTNAGWRIDWFRPAAFVVVGMLSIALILEMNDADILSTPFLKDEKTFPPEIPTNAFQEAADSAIGQIRSAEDAASSAVQNSGANAQSSSDARSTVDQFPLSPGRTDCDERERSTVTTWWRCIEALESRGASAAAEKELAALMTAFPGFVEPD